MELVVGRGNLLVALKRVERNKGSPGTGGMTVESLRPHLRENWREIREQLLTGSYRPTEVREVEIPKGTVGCERLVSQRRSTGSSSRASCK